MFDRCSYSGEKFEPYDTATIEHVIPVNCGGQNDFANYLVVKRSWNMDRSDTPLDEFIAQNPQVKENIELIENLLTEEFWMNITISVLEEIRIKLRDLIGLIDFEQRKIVYSHFEDELDQTQGISLDPSNGVDIAQYRKKVTAFLQAHENDICINKLKFNKPLTEEEITEVNIKNTSSIDWHITKLKEYSFDNEFKRLFH